MFEYNFILSVQERILKSYFDFHLKVVNLEFRNVISPTCHYYVGHVKHMLCEVTFFILFWAQ